MIDNGFPLTTEPNILREMIAPPNIVSKMLSVVTGNSSNVSDMLPGATASCMPWRTTDTKYANNEVYVDLVEEIDAIINRSIFKFASNVSSSRMRLLLVFSSRHLDLHISNIHLCNFIDKDKHV